MADSGYIFVPPDCQPAWLPLAYRLSWVQAVRASRWRRILRPWWLQSMGGDQPHHRPLPPDCEDRHRQP